MSTLNTDGQIDAGVIAFYVPVLFAALFLTSRYGFSREAGWIFLLTFSIVRIVGAALLIAAEKTVPAIANLYIGAYILEAVGLSPLMLATIGFLRLVGKNVFNEDPRMTRIFRLIGLGIIIAMALSIVGGIDQTSTSLQTIKNGANLNKIGAVIFVIMYVLLIVVHLACWQRWREIPSSHRALLSGISSALPFLGIRVLYSILSAYSTSTPSLAKFNRVTGEWQLYLMSLVLEYIVVLIYMGVGILVPLRKDYPDRIST